MTQASSDIDRPAVEARPAPRARVGVLGIGLEAYWPQFDGLRERIEGYQRRVEERVAALGAEVVSAGPVDTPQRARGGGGPLPGGAGRLVGPPPGAHRAPHQTA